MEIGFSPFATRPAQVESADDWLGEPRDSSLPLDGPVGTPAFPVQRRADDLLPPAEDSYEEPRATLSPESHSEAMGEAYGLFTEGLGGGPVGIGGEGGGADDGALTDGAASEGDGGDGGYAQDTPSVDSLSDLLDDVDDAGDDGDDPPGETPDDVADMMDAPAAFEESRATIVEDELDDADGFDVPSIDGVADVMDAPPEVDEGRATISDEPAVAVDDDGDSFGAPAIDSVADVMDAPAEFDERRATISAVQAKSSGMVGSASDIQSAAAEGVQGGGGPLPHLDKIQASFGDHDVSGVGAHVGGKAATAARAIGAAAYATGNNVAFAESPDLFTAAHEAAHVVQQRAGVQLLGGVGEVGDVYEQNADAVAHAVVRGESASHLLGGANAHAVTGMGLVSPVQKRPSPGARLSWKARKRRRKSLLKQIRQDRHAVSRGKSIEEILLDDGTLLGQVTAVANKRAEHLAGGKGSHHWDWRAKRAHRKLRRDKASQMRALRTQSDKTDRASGVIRGGQMSKLTWALRRARGAGDISRKAQGGAGGRELKTLKKDFAKWCGKALFERWHSPRQRLRRAQSALVQRMVRARKTDAEVVQAATTLLPKYQQQFDVLLVKVKAAFLIQIKESLRFSFEEQPGTSRHRQKRPIDRKTPVEGGKKIKHLGREITSGKGKSSQNMTVSNSAIAFRRELKKLGARVNVSSYPGHSQGAYSLDVFPASNKRDKRGFFPRGETIALFRKINAAAKLAKVDWKALYNDFEVAKTVNVEFGERHVNFQYEHGPDPLVSHIHLDVVPKVWPTACYVQKDENACFDEAE